MGKRKPRKRRARGTGSVYYDAPRGVWVAKAIVGRNARGGPRYAERSDPVQAEAVRKAALARPPSASATVGEWAARWLADGSARPRTRAVRKNSVEKHIAPVLGPTRLADLTPAHVERAAAEWGRELPSPNSVRLVLAHLHTCLASAVRAGVLAANPVASARKPRGVKKRIDPFTPAELVGIIGEAARRPATRVVALLAGTGCRVGEALALDAHEFDPAAGRVSINRTVDLAGAPGPPKSANGVREIRVPLAAAAVVAEARGGRSGGPLFATQHGGRSSHPLARRAWVGVLARLGLRFRNLHQLRHSWATNAIAAGVPLADVAAYLGDTVETVVRTYLHRIGVDPSLAFDRLLGGGGDAARGKGP